MRITLVFPSCTRSGGVERVVWEAARFLAARHEVTVVSTVAQDLPPGVVHVPVSESPGLFAPFRFRRAAARAMASVASDVVVAYGVECPPADVYVIGSVHLSWLRVAGPVDVHGRKISGKCRFLMPRHLISLSLERSYFERAKGSFLVPCAEQVAKDLVQLYGMVDSSSNIVHNGFSPEEFSPERCHQLRSTVRGELGFTEDDLVLIMVANEWQRKGLSTLLDAMELLGEQAVHLVLIGRASPDRLLASRRSGLQAFVHYLGPSNDVGRVHAAADVFVMPTQYEAFCLSIIEALASGLPVITTNVPGAADAIVPGVNGLLLDNPFDAHALSILITQAMDPVQRHAWRNAAPESVSHLSWEELMEQFERIIETLEIAR
jgi:UDP-glucose:(heptosyl)LPS alpha-1,3-glucosyltransferase